MAVCDCCGNDKVDVRIRVGLRGLDARGRRTTKPFHGPLCEECLARAGRLGSGEQRWLYTQITQGVQSTPNGGAVKPRRGVVVPLRAARPKPAEPRQ